MKVLRYDIACALCSLMSELLEMKQLDRAGSILSTSLLAGAVFGALQMFVLLVSLDPTQKLDRVRGDKRWGSLVLTTHH